MESAVLAHLLSCGLLSRPCSVATQTKLLQPNFLHTCHVYRYHWPLPFYTTFSDLDLVRVTRSAESKTCWLQFVAHISTDQDGMKWYWSWMSWYYYRVAFILQGSNCCFTDCIKNKQTNKTTALLPPKCRDLSTNVVQDWYTDRCLWTQHFDTSLSDCDLNTRPQRYQKGEPVCTKYFTKLSVDLEWIWGAVESDWYDEPRSLCSVSNRHSVGRTQHNLCDYVENKIGVGLHPDRNKLISFKLGVMIRH